MSISNADWSASENSEAMLAAIPVDAYQRELRLYAAACARRLWHVLPLEARAAVEVAERFANGLATLEEMREVDEAADKASQVYWSGASAPDARAYAEGGCGVSLPVTIASIQSAVTCLCSAAACAAADPCPDTDYDRVYDTTWRAESFEQAKLLRSFISFPFRS